MYSSKDLPSKLISCDTSKAIRKHSQNQVRIKKSPVARTREIASNSILFILRDYQNHESCPKDNSVLPHNSIKIPTSAPIMPRPMDG